jgi:ketosteroid isomerase-like protein
MTGQSSPAPWDELATRVARLEDESAIVRTLNRYAHALYNGDRGEFLDCFTDDAVLERARHGRRVEGRQALIEFFEAVTHAPEAYHKHVVIEPVVDLDGDVAAVSSDFLAGPRRPPHLALRPLRRRAGPVR